MKASRIALVLSALAATVFSFWIPPAKSFQSPNLARIICFHLPCAFMTTGLLFLSAYFGLRYMQTRRPEWDLRTMAATELGALFGTLTMATGILFSRVQWGAWWQWDPRQTSFLFVLLLLVAGLALRAGLADEEKRASAGAAYSLGSLVPALFLIFVFPRLPQVTQKSFHPSTTIQQGGFDGYYWAGILFVFAVVCWATVILFRQRVRTRLEAMEILNARLDVDRSHTAGPRVVEPVSLRQDGE